MKKKCFCFRIIQFFLESNKSLIHPSKLNTIYKMKNHKRIVLLLVNCSFPEYSKNSSTQGTIVSSSIIDEASSTGFVILTTLICPFAKS